MQLRVKDSTGVRFQFPIPNLYPLCTAEPPRR